MSMDPRCLWRISCTLARVPVHRSRRSTAPRQTTRGASETAKGRPKGRPGWLGLGRRLLWSWWIWIGVAIALEVANFEITPVITAAAIGFFCYLITPQEHVPRYGLETELSVHSHEFLSSIIGTTGVPFVKGNKVRVMNNGDEFYPAMLDAISQAKETITLEAFIYWAGDIGRRFAEAFAERRRAGVRVKLLLDAIGCATIGRDILRILEESGCEVAWYNPVRLHTIGRFNNRTHRKSLIVDGRIAFTGGAGIADHWTGNAQNPDHWRDVQICVEGPAAMGLQTGFTQNWLDTTGELVSGEGFFPPQDRAGTMAVQTILSTPEAGSSAVRIMYYLSIVSARETLYIANPYFIPDDSATEILIDARRRGVDVKIMLAGIHNDMRLSRYSSIHLYGKFLEAGVEIYEYNRTMMHQKVMIVDGIWSTVGTTNFDNRSFALNEESNICVYDRRFAEELEKTFLDDLKQCDRISLEQWRRRGIKTRVYGVACALLKEQT
jgi:cardiolipin synthase A/B